MYCTIDDLYEACKRKAVDQWASDDSREDEAVIRQRIESAIVRASEEMDMYIAQQYTLPLPKVPLSIRDICVKLSLYQLLSRKGLDSDSRDTTIKDNRDDAVKQLEWIATGKLSVVVTDSEENTNISSTSSVAWSFPKSKFGIGR